MSRGPGWEAVRDLIRARVTAGALMPGDRLPRDEDLAVELGCTRTTVQRAMQALTEDGLLERRRRGGTRVRPDPVARPRVEIPVVRQEVEGRGAVYGYRLETAERAVPPGEVLAAMELTAPEEMLRVCALHLADGRPWLWEDRWVSLATVPDILGVDLGRVSANEWLVRNRPWSRGAMRLSAAVAGPEEAGRLGCAAGAALFVTERTTWAGALPITHMRALAPPGYAVLSRF